MKANSRSWKEMLISHVGIQGTALSFMFHDILFGFFFCMQRIFLTT
jgi:hypothetical protein